MNHNDTGLTFTSFNASQFTIIFWFYLENNTRATILALKENNDSTPLELVIQQGRSVAFLLKYHDTNSMALFSTNKKIAHLSLAWQPVEVVDSHFCQCTCRTMETFRLDLFSGPPTVGPVHRRCASTVDGYQRNRPRFPKQVSPIARHA